MLHKKAIGLIVWAFFLLGQVNAQRSNEDIIYLKDGSVLKGQILEMEDEKIRIQLRTGQEVSLKEAEVDHLLLDKKIKESALKPGSFYHGFYFSTNTGSNFFGDSEWGLGFEHITGLWLSDAYGLGLGTGIMQFSSDYPWNVVPLYVDVKIKSDRRSPFYLGFDGGLSFPIRNEDNNILGGKPGERVRLGFGKIWTTRTGTGISMEVSYLHQRTFFKSNTWSWGNTDDISMHNIAFKRYQLRFGVLF